MGVIDITTRQNIQLRGITLEDGPAMIDGLHALNQVSQGVGSGCLGAPCRSGS